MVSQLSNLSANQTLVYDLGSEKNEFSRDGTTKVIAITDLFAGIEIFAYFCEKDINTK